MRPEYRDDAYLWDMREPAGTARDLVADMSLQAFLNPQGPEDPARRRTRPRLVGEAARRVSAGLRDAPPELSWRSIVGLRNILVHDYGEIDPACIFAVAVRDIPPLLDALVPLLPSEP